MLDRNRRAFITLLGGAATLPIAARAQQRTSIIGFLGADRFTDYENEIAAFREGLKRSVADQNVTMEFRWAHGQFGRLSDLATELLSLYIDVIFCNDSMSVQAAKTVAGNIPIIFATALDPVASGIVTSMRPQGNITGVSYASGPLGSTRLQLLRELLPKATSIAVLQNPHSPEADSELADLRTAAGKFGLRLNLQHATNSDEIALAFTAFNQERSDALVVLTDLMFISERNQIVELAAHYRMPAIYSQRFFTRAGGLMSFGASPSAAYREAGAYVGQILNGAVPADLPILLPIKFELLVNLKVANSIGLNIPDSLLLRADEVLK